MTKLQTTLTKEQEQAKKQRYAKAKQTMLERYGKDYYSSIGKRGGKNSTSRPFKDKALASLAGINSAKKKRENA